jgi:hypothetical protein
MLTKEELRAKLEVRFLGSNELRNLPIKTRGKKAREMVCEALGWPIPGSFLRTKPRFPSENFDIFVQGANNLQLWNRDVNVAQRYVFVILVGDQVRSVKILTGFELSELAKSDTKTTKLQAQFRGYAEYHPHVVVHGTDTPGLRQYLAANYLGTSSHPRRVGAMPGIGLLSMEELARALQPLIGAHFSDPGAVQERLRGQQLHMAVCKALQYDVYADTGQHPDIPNQLLELKLQMSPTIDLGLVKPLSPEPMPDPFPADLQLADVRYAVFGATKTTSATFRIECIHLVSGANFYTVFKPMGGLGENSKLQIRLPKEWFTLRHG